MRDQPGEGVGIAKRVTRHLYRKVSILNYVRGKAFIVTLRAVTGKPMAVAWPAVLWLPGFCTPVFEG